MPGQAFFSFLQQDTGLFDGFFAVLQLQAQFAHVCVVMRQ